MIGKVSHRIMPSVKLAGVKGSLKQRGKLAAELNQSFFGMVQDTFHKKGHLTLEDVSHYLKRLCPGVNLDVVQNTDQQYWGNLSFLVDITKRKYAGYKLSLNCFEKSGKQIIKDINTLFHETRHFFDYVTNPLSLAKHNDKPVSVKSPDHKFRFIKSWDFYQSKLYGNEVKDSPGITIAERKALNKKNIEEIFTVLQTPSKEKIEVLNDWREQLRTEINAWTDGITYQDLFDRKGKTPSKFAKTDIKYTIEQKYFYRGKLEVIEELLAEELAKARNDNIDKLKSKGKLSDKHPYHSAKA